MLTSTRQSLLAVAQLLCASLLLADGSEIFMLEQIHKKSLSNILCFLRCNTLALHKAVNRSPIDAAKFFQRFLRRGRFTLRLNYDAPVRTGKLHCSFSGATRRTSRRKLMKVCRLRGLAP